jgi:putative integral membrane protein (TIGR02587 family)
MPDRPGAASAESAPDAGPRPSAARRFRTGVARAFGGAIVFSLPLLMTMEMWHFGFVIAPLRLVALLLLTLPLLVGLSARSGFRETLDLKEDVVDACVAYAVGVAAAAAILLLLGIIGPGMSPDEVTGKIVLQAVPASIGALLAQSQFGPAGDDEREAQPRRPAAYGSEIFLMGVGALFLGFNVAPTEEMVLIGNTIGDWHVVALLIVSTFVMHAFVYALEFRGQEPVHPGTPLWSVFLRFTVVGYAVALLISAYVLWTFGRFEGTAWPVMLRTTIVLGFPCAVGAAAARLIL